MSDEMNTGSDAGGSDQLNYLDDAASSQPVDDSQAETPKDEAKTTEAEAPKDGKNVDGKQATKAPETPPDPIETLFKNDKGEFDVDGFASFSLPELEADEDAVVPEKVVDGSSEQPDNTPPWKKELEEVANYEKSLKANLLDPLQKVADLISSGKGPIEALNEIYVERQALLNEHMAEFRHKREFDREEARQKGIEETTKFSEAKAKASTNVNEIVSALPGDDPKQKYSVFSHVMYSKEIGAPILNREFKKAYPDAEKLPVAEQKKLADKFLVSLQSDKAELRHVWGLCMDKAYRMKQTAIAQRNRLAGASQEKERRAVAQKHPAGPYKRQQPKTGGGWDSYLDSADRI